MSPVPTIPYRIETPRLVLRCWEPQDAPALRKSLDASDAHLRPFIPFMRGEPRSLADTARRLREKRSAFDRDENYRYAFFDREQVLVGEVMLLDRHGDQQWEVGYWQDVARGGQGYATEATQAMVRVAFAVLQVRRLDLMCAPENRRSIAMAQRLGFRHEATLRRRFESPDGVLQDSMVWSMHPEEYRASPAGGLDLAGYDCLGERCL